MTRVDAAWLRLGHPTYTTLYPAYAHLTGLTALPRLPATAATAPHLPPATARHHSPPHYHAFSPHHAAVSHITRATAAAHTVTTRTTHGLLRHLHAAHHLTRFAPTGYYLRTPQLHATRHGLRARTATRYLPRSAQTVVGPDDFDGYERLRRCGLLCVAAGLWTVADRVACVVVPLPHSYHTLTPPPTLDVGRRH